MHHLLYTGAIPPAKGIKIPIEKLTFSFIEGKLILSLGFNHKLTDEQCKDYGLELAVQGATCGWWMYRPNNPEVDIYHSVES